MLFVLILPNFAKSDKTADLFDLCKRLLQTFLGLGVANVDLSGNLARMSGTEIMEADVSELIKKRNRLDREVGPALSITDNTAAVAQAPNLTTTVRLRYAAFLPYLLLRTIVVCKC